MRNRLSLIAIALFLTAAGLLRADGRGGTADCHDSSLYFSGCYRLSESEKKKKKHDDDDSEAKFARIKIALADLPGFSPGVSPPGDVGNTAFLERTTIYIDGQKDKHGT